MKTILFMFDAQFNISFANLIISSVAMHYALEYYQT